jgi:hypothetical protein
MSVPIAFFINELRFSKIVIGLFGISGIFYALFCFNRPIIKFPPLTTNTYFTQARIAHFYHMEEKKGKDMQALIAYLKEKGFKKIGVKSEQKYGNDQVVAHNKEILKTINTLAFVINHMESELKSKCMYLQENEIETHHFIKIK